MPPTPLETLRANRDWPLAWLARERVLVLDDECWRQLLFLQWWPCAVVTDRAEVAITRLRTERWDVLCLDHDLIGTGEPLDGRPAVGRDVATWLVSHPDRAPRRWTLIHSMNVVSAKKIERELLRGGLRTARVPFNDLIRLASMPVHDQEPAHA